MPTRCIIDGCNANNDIEAKYRFPKDEAAKLKWINAIPQRYKITAARIKPFSVICGLHWPSSYEKISVKGRLRPKFPPFSACSEPNKDFRTTSKTTFGVRNILPDELADFEKRDVTTFEVIKCCFLQQPAFRSGITSFCVESSLFIQSTYFRHGIPQFVIKVAEDLTFETYHWGVQCLVPFIQKMRNRKLNRWSLIIFLTWIQVSRWIFCLSTLPRWNPNK